MGFLKININSTRTFYTDEFGKIYNRFYKELKCGNINGSICLNFIVNDGLKKSCTKPIARLIYNAYYPDEDLSKYNIYRKELDIENPYQIGNLKKVLKSEMPIQNKLPDLHRTNPPKKKFYEKLSEVDYNNLILLAKIPEVTCTKISQLYNVSLSAVWKNRPFLAKQNQKHL